MEDRSISNGLGEGKERPVERWLEKVEVADHRQRDRRRRRKVKFPFGSCEEEPGGDKKK